MIRDHWLEPLLVRCGRAWVPIAVFAALVAFATGCGHQALATADGLPVRRVVIYRNGVAYFERAGHVVSDEVRFRMKPTEIGDFLATLAVMERGGSSVRAAAFPLEETASSPPGTDEPASSSGPSGEHVVAHASHRPELTTVVLSLDGKEHDLVVGYVAESPVWRPSYRLVLRTGSDAELQAWGIVENLSGEDWKHVRLTLVAGAPLAFQADLGTPVIPARPIVSDQGEVITAVPTSETSLNQESEAAGAMSATAAPAAPASESPSKSAPAMAPKVGALARDARAGSTQRRGAGEAFGAEPGVAPRPQAYPSPPVSPPRSLRALAAIADKGGTTRYDLPLEVTVPDRSATMVLLLSQRVVGEAMYLFAPDGGVADSTGHPFRVARFANSASGALERGPIAVFDAGSFLGQGIVDPLPSGATTTVPFALERGIGIDSSRSFDQLGARVAKIDAGQLTVELDAVTQTRYRVRSGLNEPAKVLVKHARIVGSRLTAPSAGTEDNVGTGSALVPVAVPPRATVELLVDERVPLRQGADWFGALAESAFKTLLADPKADPALVAKLGPALQSRRQIIALTEERSKLAMEVSTLERSAEDTRRNLKAIEKNKLADGLRQKMTVRLADAATRLDDLNRRIVEIDAKVSELTVRFKEAVRDIQWAL